jgi:hypothetical protein
MMLTEDTNGVSDEDEPFVDICYISDMLVNMITGDSQQIGDFTPWSFDLFGLGLDIILPRMNDENFKVSYSTALLLMIDSATSNPFFDFVAAHV